MGIFDRLFGKKPKEAVPKVYTEKDNRGTRHDTIEFATGYWIARMTSPHKDPFVLYSFAAEADARQALLELPCIHVAEDTGNLICTEPALIYGYYPTNEGNYEAILCGADLTHDLWAQAKASFIKHGGQPKGQGELEPGLTAASPVKAAKPQPSKVVFVREDHQYKMGATFTYRIYKAPNAASAMAYLEQNPVTKQLFYIIIETPEGNYCRDIQGIYKE